VSPRIFPPDKGLFPVCSAVSFWNNWRRLSLKTSSASPAPPKLSRPSQVSPDTWLPRQRANGWATRKPPFGGPEQALEYLGSRTHRIAIYNQRLQSIENGNVTFQWKDYRNKDKQKSKTMTLASEFIRRFLIHTLPQGFPRIRHFGLLANRNRKAKLALCRKLMNNPILELLPGTTLLRPADP
jgi:hypothetical protein